MKNLATITASTAAVAAVALLAMPQQASAAQHNKEMKMSDSEALNQALASEYADMAAEEAEELDVEDQTHFQKKGQMAAKGMAVMPDNPHSRPISGTESPYAERTYQRIMNAYDGGASTKSPRLLAQAQAGYDCWLQETEEGYQLLHIWRCRDKADAALDAIENPPKPKAKPMPAPTPARTYTLYFGFDSTEIDADAFDVIDKAMSDFRDRGNAEIDVTGHADTAGPAKYNQGLSNRRADAVADVLELRGVAADRIDEAALGETLPAVQTGDGVPERLNRRVVIIVQDRQ